MNPTKPKASRSLSAVLDGNTSSSQNDGCPSPKRSRTTLESESPAQPSPPQQQWLASHQIADKISVIQVMKRKESTTYKPHHYLEHTTVSADDRRDLCQWGFDIMDTCKVNRNVAVIAIGYFDRFLSHRGLRVVEACLANERHFQLAFILCSWFTRLLVSNLLSTSTTDMSCHSIEGTRGYGSQASFVASTMCEDMYHPEEIVAMEIEILRTLGWFLNGPTCKDFIAHFVDLLPTESDRQVASTLYEAAIQKTEMSLLDYSLALETPSSLALASIASLIRDMSPQQQNALQASKLMGLIGFVMGAAVGGMNQGTDVKDEDTSLLTVCGVSDDDTSKF